MLTKILKNWNMKEAVVTIRGKDSDKFEGQYKGSTWWFNPDCEFFLRKFSTIEPEFYKNFMKMILKVKICNRIRHFLYRLIVLS